LSRSGRLGRSPTTTWRPIRFAPVDFAQLLAQHGFESLKRVGYADEPRWGLPALNIGDERIVLAIKRG
jgi:hypothetical protein